VLAGLRRALALMLGTLALLAAQTVTAFGDSLTAGYGLDESAAWPALLAAAHPQWQVLNAGVSGETTSGGLRRIDWVLRARPAIVLIGLGANDGLRGQDAAQTEANLTAIIAKVRAAGARPILLGMRLPTSLGPEFTASYAELYPRLAAAEGIPLLPFLLEGVAGNPDLNLPDGIHPNEAGHRIIAAQVGAFLAGLPP
jgi:acyl-CoA thioesterase-1